MSTENFKNLQQRLLQPERKKNRILKSILPVTGTILAMALLTYLGWNAYQENVSGPVDLTKIPVVKAESKPYKIEAQNDSEAAASHEKKVYEAIASGKNESEDSADSGINVVTQGTEQPIDRSNVSREEITAVETKPVAEEAQPAAQEIAAAPVENIKQENIKQESKADNRLPDDDTDVAKPAENIASAAAPENKKSDEKKIGEEKPAAPAKKIAAEKVPNGAIKIQLGAYKSEDEAKQNWARISRKYSQYLSGLKPIITKAEIKDKGGFYRLQAGPVKSEPTAREICRKLLVAKQGCFNVNAK